MGGGYTRRTSQLVEVATEDFGGLSSCRAGLLLALLGGMTRTLITIVAVGWMTGCGAGIEIEAHSRQTAVVNGKTDTGHAAVGLLKLGSSLCTGTLIGSRTVLTAAHCVEGTSAKFEIAGKSYDVAQMTPHPGYSSAVLNVNDIA